ncbi:MAG: hypothetical protein ABI797_06395, partial [Chloroflexota bacterium]
EDLAAADDLISEGYAIAMRHGLLTWGYQFAHVALTQVFERGNWDAWIDVTTELDAPGFYGAWRLIEQGQRDVLRGRVAEGRFKLAEATERAGTESSQAVAAIAGVEAVFAFATQDWAAVMPAIRRSWDMLDMIDFAVPHAAAAAAGANAPDWVREAQAAFEGFGRRGRHMDGLRASMRTTLALLEGRWPDARAAYLDARRDLTAADSRYFLALLDLGVGTRGQGHLPEAAEAMTAARDFFASVGADHLADAFVAALVPATAPEPTARTADAPAGVPSA